jgi:hypothetical protein
MKNKKLRSELETIKNKLKNIASRILLTDSTCLYTIITRIVQFKL